MAIHSRILHNGEIVEANAAPLYAGQLGLLAGWGVFSTLRVQDGCLFAWERHWARLARDARLLNIEMPPSADSLCTDLMRLVRANGRPDCTLRVNIVRNGGGVWEDPTAFQQASDVIALTADSKRWGESVRLSVQPHARYAASEFSGAKIISWAHNLRWAERAQLAGFDETILLNEHGRVSECTSANIFAVFGSDVRTPPVADGCLAGITREVLLKEIRIPAIEIREEVLSLTDLQTADAVFITSSTRDLLPVREIEGSALQSIGDVREKLSDAFTAFIASDIAQRKSLAALRGEDTGCRSESLDQGMSAGRLENGGPRSGIA